MMKRAIMALVLCVGLPSAANAQLDFYCTKDFTDAANRVNLDLQIAVNMQKAPVPTAVAAKAGFASMLAAMSGKPPSASDITAEIAAMQAQINATRAAEIKNAFAAIGPDMTTTTIRLTRALSCMKSAQRTAAATRLTDLQKAIAAAQSTQQTTLDYATSTSSLAGKLANAAAAQTASLQDAKKQAATLAKAASDQAIVDAATQQMIASVNAIVTKMLADILTANSRT